jgi:hypothetical protein
LAIRQEFVIGGKDLVWGGMGGHSKVNKEKENIMKRILFFLTSSIFYFAGCESYGPKIPGPEFTNRKIKNIDVWFIILDSGVTDVWTIPLTYNSEIADATIYELTQKGYSVKNYRSVQGRNCVDDFAFSNFSGLLRKQYPSGQPPSDIDAVFLVEAQVFYRMVIDPTTTAGSEGTPYGYYYRTSRNPPTSDIGDLRLCYIISDPSLKKHILTGYGGGQRRYEIVSSSPIGRMVATRWKFVENQEEYVRRCVDDTFKNLPECQNVLEKTGVKENEVIPTRKKQNMSFEIEGGIKYATSVTTIKSNSEQIVGISRTDVPIGVSGIGSYLEMGGLYKLKWSPKDDEVYELNGKIFLGIRKDSPSLLDMAFVVDSSQTVPEKLQAYKKILIELNSDSVFLTPKFTNPGNIVWLCKLKDGSNSGSFTYIDWYRESGWTKETATLTSPVPISLKGLIKQVDLENSRATITIGSVDGVQKNMKFHVTRGNLFICDLRIIEVDTNTAVGIMELVQMPTKVDDYVSTSL